MSEQTRGDDDGRARLTREAAEWVARMDRGLAAGEQDAFSDWLAADPRHRETLARVRAHWARLDALEPAVAGAEPDPDLLAPPSRVRPLFVATLAAAAAAVFAGVLYWQTVAPARSEEVVIAATVEPAARVLTDGSVVALDPQTEMTVRYTTEERHVRLDRGEAHFAVTRDPDRPFVVRAAGVDIRAVGTAFKVRVDAQEVEVIVTEGRVQVDPAPALEPAASASPVLEARQRAIVSRTNPSAPPQIDALPADAVERLLARRHRPLDFNAAPLREIVAEFNRHNPVRIVVADPEVADIRISASFRADNVDGFVRLLQARFPVRVERRGDEIVLEKQPAGARE